MVLIGTSCARLCLLGTFRRGAQGVHREGRPCDQVLYGARRDGDRESDFVRGMTYGPEP